MESFPFEFKVSAGKGSEPVAMHFHAQGTDVDNARANLAAMLTDALSQLGGAKPGAPANGAPKPVKAKAAAKKAAKAAK